MVTVFSFFSEPPSFIKKLVSADVVKGSTASFECLIAGTGPFEIIWHKDAKEIKPSSKHGLSQTDGTVGLDVHKCDTVDIGEYQCTVANEVGSCTCKTMLNLKGWYWLLRITDLTFEMKTEQFTFNISRFP